MIREVHIGIVVRIAGIVLLIAILALALQLDDTQAGGQTFVVNVAENAVDVPDGICDATSCTLTDAIIAHNNNSLSHNTITFDPAAFPLGDDTGIIPLEPFPKIRANNGITVDATGADVTIFGFEMNPVGPGFEFTSEPLTPVRDVVVRNIGFSAMPEKNILVCPAPTLDVDFPCGYDIENVLIEDIHIELAADIGVLVRGADLDDVTVRGLTAIDSNMNYAVRLLGRSISDVTIEDNTMTSSGSILITAEGTGVDLSNVTIADNEMETDQIWIQAHGVNDLAITGNHLLGTSGNGISVDVKNLGDSEIADNEVIGAQSVGIFVSSPDDLSGLQISGNKVTDNGNYGIYVDNQFGASPGNIIEDNEIRENSSHGILISRGGPVTISQNSLSNNGGLGIDLAGNGVTPNDPGDADSGANDFLNFPEITASDAQTVSGVACANCYIELFLADPDPSGYGEGQEFLRAGNASGAGQFLINVCDLGLTSGATVTATARDFGGNTSEFALNHTLTTDVECPTASPTPIATITPSPTPTPSPPQTTPPGTTPAITVTPTPTGPMVRSWGDSDCDGEISSRDNQALLRNVLSQAALSQTPPCPALGSEVEIDGTNQLWGDWDCDGEISSRDNQALLRKVLSQAALSQTPPCPGIGDEVELVT